MSILNKIKCNEFYRNDDRFSYGINIGKFDNHVASVWIRCEDSKETLVCRYGDKQIDIIAGKYIISPVICNDRIIFSYCDQGNNWSLKIADISVEKVIIYDVTVKGRVMSLRCETQSNSNWVSFESRTGKTVKVYAAFIGTNENSTRVIPVTDGKYNAYDPHIALAKDGFLYVTYTAYFSGNYHIMLKKMDIENKIQYDEVRISDQAGTCYWPSIASGNDGGVWISWCSFTRAGNFEETYLQHHKNEYRRRLFEFHPAVYAGLYKDDQLYFPITDKTKTGGYLEGFAVENSAGSKQPTIVQLEDGSLHIVYRKFRGENKLFNSPDISIATLTDRGWSNPEPIVSRGLHEGYTSLYPKKDSLSIAYSEDNRSTGWGKDGEWFDTERSVCLGIIQYKPPVEFAKEIQFEKYNVSPVSIPSMEEENYTPIHRKDGSKLIWGQTHCHTDHSICVRMCDQSVDFNYRFMQDVQKSGYGACTDHKYNQWALEEHLNHKAADYYYYPGEFVSVPGYEWTGSKCTHDGGPFGHVNPLLFEDNAKMKFYTPFDPSCDGASLNKLWKTYEHRRIITIPHHTSDKMHTFNWDNYNPAMMPVVEIFQDLRGQHEAPGVWGSTAYTKNPSDGWVIDALKRGYKMGFIGGGDHIGLARGGVEVKELTREGLYDGFVSRRTYASTGTGADIVYECNGYPAGSECHTSNAQFNLKISAGRKIIKIQIVKNGDTIEEMEVYSNRAEHSWESDRVEQEEFWYCRILFDNGEVIWTSPIWILG